jgi:hypothetical protein
MKKRETRSVPRQNKIIIGLYDEERHRKTKKHRRLEIWGSRVADTQRGYFLIDWRMERKHDCNSTN